MSEQQCWACKGTGIIYRWLSDVRGRAVFHARTCSCQFAPFHKVPQPAAQPDKEPRT